jgi:hypothetical protein
MTVGDKIKRDCKCVWEELSVTSMEGKWLKLYGPKA